MSASNRSRVIIVSPYAPVPVGHGGNHRSYQIHQDVQEAVGQANVAHLCLEEWVATHPEVAEQPPRPIARHIRESLAFRWNALSENPLRLLAGTHFTARGVLHPGFLADYRRLVEDGAGQVICVSEHPMFEMIWKINVELHIPTILCSHNLDALSQNLRALADRNGAGRWNWPAYAAAGDLVSEIEAMSRYDELLLISRAEVAITGGLGLDSRYYPYVPVGAIRQRNEQIRRRRASASFEPGLFILMGSARHYPTRRSLEWFVGSACRHGLPAGVHVIALGHDTNTLPARHEIPAGLELWGWLGQEELDDLLGRAPAVLIPQKLGFGALTRLPELACAGVPVVTTAYPTYAIDPTPGIHVVEGGWDAWCAAMAQLAREEPPQLEACYRQWEGRQPRTLNDVLSQYSERSMSRAALSR